MGQTHRQTHTHRLGVVYVKICEVAYDFANKNKKTFLKSRQENGPKEAEKGKRSTEQQE